MSQPATSTANAPSYESALERWRLARLLFGVLTPSFQDFTDQLENRLSSSSPGSPDGPFLQSVE